MKKIAVPFVPGDEVWGLECPDDGGAWTLVHGTVHTVKVVSGNGGWIFAADAAGKDGYFPFNMAFAGEESAEAYLQAASALPCRMFNALLEERGRLLKEALRA